MKLVILAVGRGRATLEQELATEWLVHPMAVFDATVGGSLATERLVH